MPTQLTWSDDLDRIAQTRALCYSGAQNLLEKFKQGIRDDGRATTKDYLLAEENGRAVGTATNMDFTMYVRGAPLPCQGVAYVGTIKTHRRRSGGETAGVATLVMQEMLRRAREAGQVLTALMPFRASYYEHFGYGIVERRFDWTVPLAILPKGPFDGIEFLDPAHDLEALKALRQLSVQQGQCDVQRTDASWKLRSLPTMLWQSAGAGLEVIDRPDPAGPARGYAYFLEEVENNKKVMRVQEWHVDSPASFRRLLSFFGSMKDQYSFLKIQLPADIELNWLLKETQIPHRPVDHPVAEARPFTRMQVRVLDHKRLLEAIKTPASCGGRVVVDVHESEGDRTRFEAEFDAGRIAVKASQASATFTCADRVWAAVALGHVRATDALRWGLAEGTVESAAVLDSLAQGRAPFCTEYF